MRITKLEHAAMIIDEGGRKLVVDPGALTTPLVDVRDVDAVVVTHEHADHWTPEQLRRLRDLNPGVQIIGTAGVAQAAEEFDVHVAEPGAEGTIGAFRLRFFGGRHAEIHRSIPIVDNLGVLVDERLYYPGDSFAVPEGVEVDTLAAPAGAPWLKIGEAMDFVEAVRPRRAFPTHYGVLSAAGLNIANDRLRAVTEAGGGEYHALAPDDVLDI